MATVNYGGLQLQDGGQYQIRIMDLYQQDSVAVKGFPNGLYLGEHESDGRGSFYDNCNLRNKLTVVWRVRDRGDGSFSLQNQYDYWICDTPNTNLFVTRKDGASAAVFIASAAGASNIGILRLKRTDETTLSFCGCTNFYSMDANTVVPEYNFIGQQISANGNFLPGEYREQYFKEVVPRKVGVATSNSAFFNDKVKNTNATAFRLMFTPG